MLFFVEFGLIPYLCSPFGNTLKKMEELFHFRKFLADEDEELVERCYEAAVEKLQTLFPGKRITAYGRTEIGIESDSIYASNGQDMYALGLIDEETPALRREGDEEVVTFRV